MKNKKQESKPKKIIYLKQYLVSGAQQKSEEIQKAAFILHTCPKLANEEFKRKFPGYIIWHTTVTAESQMTKDDLEKYDFWKEHKNWILINK